MMELSSERVAQIMNEETLPTVELPTLLRSIYARYMRLYEQYFEDIDALNEEKLSRLRTYHEETKSLVKYYYMDIPYDICADINRFEEKYSDKLLGPKWHDFVFDYYHEFKNKCKDDDKSEEHLKVKFQQQIMTAFYETMSYVFRDGFGTGSRHTENMVKGITGLLFAK